MHVKPKEILVNIPVVLMFNDYHEIPAFAASLNGIIHGKVKLKYEELGILGKQYVGLFYFQRNDEYHKLRNSFLELLEHEEIKSSSPPLNSDLFAHLESAADTIPPKKEEHEPGWNCRRVPECGCGWCYDSYGGNKP